MPFVAVLAPSKATSTIVALVASSFEISTHTSINNPSSAKAEDVEANSTEVFVGI